MAVKFLQNDSLASDARELGFVRDRPFCPADTWIPWPNFHQSEKTMGIHLAAQYGLRQACSTLLSNNLPAGVEDSYGRTPLFWASLYGHMEVVKLLLDCEDVAADTKDTKGRTPLICAAQW